jgi:triosephosphate isomerase
MRTKIVAGNWKMNREKGTAKKLVEEIIALGTSQGLLADPTVLQMVICPPSLLIPECADLLAGQSAVFQGAQNCHPEPKGAFTGEISAPMLKTYGVSHVIIGHSERRQYFHETNAFIHQKLLAVIGEGLCPILCCGELIDERQANKHFSTVEAQLAESVFKLDKALFDRVVIAYEPVWAIGTGLTATPEQAQEMHSFIRNLFERNAGKDVAERLIILYGGSCNASNAKELFSKSDVDGGLIGGASLKAEDFTVIAKAALDINSQKA